MLRHLTKAELVYFPRRRLLYQPNISRITSPEKPPFSPEPRSPDGLLPVHLWVDSVPVGAIVLMAIVSDGERALGDVLQALAPLGVPQAAPPLGRIETRTVGGNTVRRIMNPPAFLYLESKSPLAFSQCWQGALLFFF